MNPTGGPSRNYQTTWMQIGTHTETSKDIPAGDTNDVIMKLLTLPAAIHPAILPSRTVVAQLTNAGLVALVAPTGSSCRHQNHAVVEF